MPSYVQDNITEFVDSMRSNNRVKKEHELFELSTFVQCDINQDGILDLDEYFAFWNAEYNYFVKQCGQYIEKTDEEVEADYEMLCKISNCDVGTDFYSFNKIKNILMITTAHIKLE